LSSGLEVTKGSLGVGVEKVSLILYNAVVRGGGRFLGDGKHHRKGTFFNDLKELYHAGNTENIYLDLGIDFDCSMLQFNDTGKGCRFNYEPGCSG
jgi:hypothetical protein